MTPVVLAPPGTAVPHCVGTVRRSRRLSGPEALGSPAGCVVPPGRRLLRPHPRLRPAPAALGLGHSAAGLTRAAGSPIYSAHPSSRAVSNTPADRAVWNHSSSARVGLRPVRKWARHPQDSAPIGTCAAQISRLQSSLDAAAREVARPAPTEAFTFELAFRKLPPLNVEYDYAGKRFNSRGRSQPRSPSWFAA
jgi:hypothetical protein